MRTTAIQPGKAGSSPKSSEIASPALEPMSEARDGRLRILYLLPSLDYSSMGGTLRHYHLLRQLGKRHAITLLALSETDPSEEQLREFSSFTEHVFVVRARRDDGLSPASGRSVWSRTRRKVQRTLRLRSAIREMKEAFNGLARREEFDLVVFCGEDLYPVVEDCNGLPLVADICDATPARFRQWLRYAPVVELPWRVFRYFESKRQCARLLRQTPFQSFITSRDRNALRGAVPDARVIPNGLDLTYWTRGFPRPHAKSLVFTGVMNYPPNADAAHFLIERVVPQIRARVRDFEVFIVGRYPSPELRAAASRAPEVVVTGAVADIRPYLERASVFAAPIRFASGLQNKVLEALAMELPVVTTPVVAEGLRVEGAGEPPVQVVPNAGDFAGHILELFERDEERARLATEGRKYVEDHFDWLRSAMMFENLCQAAARARD
jgi:glycosyltransferase involved in cell wall biosynthesis